jgi:hypothetical protein
MPELKQCTKCREQKERTEFYAHPKTADRLLSACKECTKKAVRENRARNIEYYRQFDRERAMLPHRAKARTEYQRTPGGKAALLRGRRSYVSRNPDKYLAVTMVNNAIRDGRLKKMPCEVCGATYRIHGHHDRYDRPLEVVWLCATHHAERHKKMREEARSKKP